MISGTGPSRHDIPLKLVHMPSLSLCFTHIPQGQNVLSKIKEVFWACFQTKEREGEKQKKRKMCDKDERKLSHPAKGHT